MAKSAFIKQRAAIFFILAVLPPLKEAAAQTRLNEPQGKTAEWARFSHFVLEIPAIGRLLNKGCVSNFNSSITELVDGGNWEKKMPGIADTLRMEMSKHCENETKKFMERKENEIISLSKLQFLEKDVISFNTHFGWWTDILDGLPMERKISDSGKPTQWNPPALTAEQRVKSKKAEQNFLKSTKNSKFMDKLLNFSTNQKNSFSIDEWLQSCLKSGSRIFIKTANNYANSKGFENILHDDVSH